MSEKEDLRISSTIRYCDPEFEIICKKKGCNETHYYKDLRIANTICKCDECFARDLKWELKEGEEN